MARLFIKFSWVLFTFFLCTVVFGQNDSTIDSLKLELRKAEYDSIQASLNLNIAIKYNDIQNGEKALNYALNSFKYYKKYGAKKEQALTLNTISLSYLNSSNYQKCIEYNLKALLLYEALGDSSSIGNSTSQIGVAYYYLQNWDKAIEYFNKAFILAKGINNIKDQARFMNNIGVIYEKQGAYQKALEYNTKTLLLKEQIGDSLSISRTLSNIGAVYNRLKDYKKALEYFRKSLKIKRIYSEDKNGLSLVLQNTGHVYYKLNEFNLAIKYVEEGLEVAKEANNLYQQQEAYLKLGDIYDDMKNYKKANKYIWMSYHLKDTITQINNAKLIAEMDAKFEANKKDNEIALQQKEIEKQNAEVQLQTTQKIWFAIGLFLAVILLFVAYRGIKLKQKANHLLEEKNVIIEEKNKDITDSITYASNIQQSILPDSSQITAIVPENFIYFKPKDIVSGDFYWFHEKKDYIFLMAADCTGHGVPGAFVSMLCNNVMNQVVIEKDVNDSGEILTQVNKIIIQLLKKKGANFTSSDGMDCSLCVIEKKSKHISFAGAYNQLVYINNKIINEVKADRTPIGGRTSTDFKFKSNKIITKKGDCFYLFSDGYADQFGGQKGKKFMVKRLKQLFADIHQLSLNDQRKHLDKTLTDWKGDNEQVDDILILGFKL